MRIRNLISPDLIYLDAIDSIYVRTYRYTEILACVNAAGCNVTSWSEPRATPNTRSQTVRYDGGAACVILHIA